MSNSISDSCSPSTSALTIAVTMSSVGAMRFSWPSAFAYVNISTETFIASSGDTRYSGSELPTILFDHSNSFPRSSCGTPRISAIACNGSSAAMSVTKSHSPRSITRSTISRLRRRTCSSNSLMTRGVNADDTSLRYRVCCGGSIISIIVPTPASGPMSGSMIPPPSASGAFSDE